MCTTTSRRGSMAKSSAMPAPLAAPRWARSLMARPAQLPMRRRIGSCAGLAMRERAQRGAANGAGIADDFAIEPRRDVLVHIGNQHALRRVTNLLGDGDSGGDRPAAAIRVEGHDPYRAIDLREVAHIHVGFVGDVPVEEYALVIDDAPAVASLRWERYAYDLCPTR